jgi:hypothetical protein
MTSKIPNPKNKFSQNKTKDTNITVHSIQLKNPILKDFFFAYNTDPNLPSDFAVSNKYFCFFLSLKYHEAFPAYIDDKLSKFDQNAKIQSNTTGILKYLFCIVDIVDQDQSDKLISLKEDKLFNLNLEMTLSENSSDLFSDLNCQKNNDPCPFVQESKLEKLMTDLNFICMNNNTMLVLCYSGFDLAQYIYSLSQMENTSYIEERINSINIEENILEALCMIDKINKNDATSLLNNFQDIRSICNSSAQILSLVPGMNHKKIKSIEEFFNFNFKK